MMKLLDSIQYYSIINMNKCIVLIILVMVMFVDSNDVKTCLQTKSGIQAFLIAYNNVSTTFTGRLKCAYVRGYFNKIFKSVTKDYPEDVILSPEDWCKKYHENDDLMEGGYRIRSNHVDTELSASFQAFSYSYFNTSFNAISRKNPFTQEYYTYILNTYKPILLMKRIPNPVEYCNGQSGKGLPSNYRGLYVDHTDSNNDINVQDQSQKENSGEGSSHIFNVVKDNEGQEIDLNNPYHYNTDINKD